MNIKKLLLKNFRGFKEAEIEFGDFNCLIGPNGIGKTSVLESITLLTSSLSSFTEERLRAYLKRNIPEGSGGGFTCHGVFEHEGKELEVVCSEAGFVRNDIMDSDLWRSRIAHFARFDLEMTEFQLRKDLWPEFARHFEAITGFKVEPDEYTETDLVDMGMDGDMVIGFWMDKGKRGKVSNKRGSAGEKKITKSLSTVVNLCDKPDIALVDNIEMHVHYKRHLSMMSAIKDLFSGMQIISTTHSTVVMEEYEPKSHLIDLEEIVDG